MEPDPRAAREAQNDSVQPEIIESAVLGRSAERVAAASLLEEVAAGDGGLLLLTGEAGIGKTTCCMRSLAMRGTAG